MPAFVEIKPLSTTLSDDCKVIKKAEYQRYLDAQDIVSQAKQQALDIIATAQQAREEEKRRGYQDGLEHADTAQGTAMMHTLDLCQQYLSEHQNDIVELAISVVHKVLGNFTQDSLFIAAAQEALSKYKNSQTIVLHVAPERLTSVQDNIDKLSEKWGIAGKLTLLGDESLASEACILETPVGRLDASLSSQLVALEAALRNQSQQ
ncbi:MAG: HrpE/YscL family type III secretion apparatus protein [Alteromonadaceae bacterium]|nr:HrpE/YscL family type III secretion apparatus protein [Alteromonadaceae bacterium]